MFGYVVKLQMQISKWVSDQDFEGLIKIPIVLEAVQGFISSRP